jgi:hypothetical protein
MSGLYNVVIARIQEQCVLTEGKKSDYALGIVPGMYRGLKTISHNGALFERRPNG